MENEQNNHQIERENNDNHYDGVASKEVEIDECDEETALVTEPYEKVGFWLRFWAYIIDVVIVSSVNAIVLSPVIFFENAVVLEWEFISVMGILSGIVYYLYFFLMTKIFSQTLGKMIIGIKVISSEKQETTWGDLFFREVVGRFLHNVFFILKLLYLTVAFTDDKKGIHDMIGNTRVVHVKS